MPALLKPIKVKRVSDQATSRSGTLYFGANSNLGSKSCPSGTWPRPWGEPPHGAGGHQAVVTLGLLEHRQGQGTFVRSISDQRDSIHWPP